MEKTIIEEINKSEQIILNNNNNLSNDKEKDLEEEEKEVSLKKKEEMKIKANNMSRLKLQIDNLTKNEYIEIFKIIKMNNEKYSQNKNGVMFDLMKFSAKTVDEINNFIKYIENNSLLVEHDEETRNIFRTLLN
jgi:hypothetical protein